MGNKVSTPVVVVVLIVVIAVLALIYWRTVAAKRPTGPTGVKEMMRQGGQFTGQGSGAPGGAPPAPPVAPDQ